MRVHENQFFVFFTKKSINIILKATFILIIESIGVQIIVLLKEKNFVIFFRKGKNLLW